MGCGPGKEASPGPPAQPAARLSSLPNLPAGSPRPSLASREAQPWVGVPREAAHSARTRLRGASSKQTLPAPPGAQLPGSGRDGRGRVVPRRQPAARPPAARSLTSLRQPATWSGPAPRRLGAARQHAHRHMRAAERAARTQERAPPRARPRPRSRTAARTLPGSAREREMQAHCFRLPYISSRAPGSGAGGGPYGTGPAPDPPPTRGRQVGAVESPPHPSWRLSRALLYSLDPPASNELHGGSCRAGSELTQFEGRLVEA